MLSLSLSADACLLSRSHVPSCVHASPCVGCKGVRVRHILLSALVPVQWKDACRMLTTALVTAALLGHARAPVFWIRSGRCRKHLSLKGEKRDGSVLPTKSQGSLNRLQRSTRAGWAAFRLAACGGRSHHPEDASRSAMKEQQNSGHEDEGKGAQGHDAKKKARVFLQAFVSRKSFNTPGVSL